MTNKHQILVVGVGSIGERHVRCFQHTGRTEVGLCEVNPVLRNQVAQRYGIDRAFESLDTALEHPWDAAVIATPAITHIRLAMQCARAGLALLIEKPLAVEPSEVMPLIELVEQQKIAAAVAYVYRAHPALAAMRQAIAGGELGKPLQLVAVSGQPFPIYRPGYARTYYAHHETGGGAIQDALTHVLNAGEWLIGPITRLCADAAHLALPEVNVEDTVHVFARHGEVLASYALNQHQSPNENSVTVVCEHGTARFDLHEHACRMMINPDGAWRVRRTNFRERDDWFTAQEHAFLDVLDGQAQPLCTLTEGLQTLRVNRATLASAKQHGASQTIEPQPVSSMEAS